MTRGPHIGKAARETGFGIHAIRFYEREGLLKKPIRGRSEVLSVRAVEA